MKLRIHEIFRTFQGEGSRAGEPAVFVRFTGCNLWSGLESDRKNGKGQCARWCDTDFATGDAYTPDEAFEVIVGAQGAWARPLIVFTGGEPMLWLRLPPGMDLAHRLYAAGYPLALETNGTIAIPDELVDLLDHVTVSPKPLIGPRVDRLDHVHVRSGTDIKVIWPAPFDMDELKALARGFDHRYLQPMDPLVRDGESNPVANLPETLSAAGHLGWRVSMQVHKLAGLP